MLQRHSKELSEELPSDMEHLTDGLLLYRIRNEIHQREAEERAANEKQVMEGAGDSFNSRRLKRAANSFNKRLHARRMALPVGADVTATELNALNNSENILLVSTEQLEQLQFAPTTKSMETQPNQARFSRLRRASEARNVSFKGSTNYIQPKPSAEQRAKAKKGRLINQDDESLRPTSRPRSRSASPPRSPNERSDSDSSVINNGTRLAIDKLLLAQLDQGVLPEMFIKRGRRVGNGNEDAIDQADENDDECVTVDLSNYGIGDVRGLCLGRCLADIPSLQSLGLSENRLTSRSLPSIFRTLKSNNLLHLDLSFNDLHEGGSHALAGYAILAQHLFSLEQHFSNFNRMV